MKLQQGGTWAKAVTSTEKKNTIKLSVKLSANTFSQILLLNTDGLISTDYMFKHNLYWRKML